MKGSVFFLIFLYSFFCSVCGEMGNFKFHIIIAILLHASYVPFMQPKMTIWFDFKNSYFFIPQKNLFSYDTSIDLNLKSLYGWFKQSSLMSQYQLNYFNPYHLYVAIKSIPAPSTNNPLYYFYSTILKKGSISL